MCVEKNERADDSRIKSWVQNFLGGLVLFALPGLASLGIDSWRTLGIIANDQQHLVATVDALDKRIDRLDEWRSSTEKDHFRWSDGEALRQAVAGVAQELHSVKESVTAHHNRAERYIEKIEQMEKSSHKHRYEVAK